LIGGLCLAREAEAVFVLRWMLGEAVAVLFAQHFLLPLRFLASLGRVDLFE
jgi:hypothetical protein